MNRIKQLREENNITQIQLAKKLNKTQQTISLYENGTNEPDIDGYIILSKIFNCSIEYIAGKSDIRNPEEVKNSKINVAFSSGYDGLNETNQNIINATIAGLLAKQKEEEKHKNNKENKKEK